MFEKKASKNLAVENPQTPSEILRTINEKLDAINDIRDKFAESKPDFFKGNQTAGK